MRLIALLALTFAALPAQAERLSLRPVDQGDRDPSLVEFRRGLLAGVAARDIDAVVAAACPDIYLSHGGDGGPDELRHNLTLPPETLADEFRDQADEMRDAYWTALQDTLSAPGYFDDQGEFWMPFQWQIRLPASVDPFTAYFVTGTRVTLRADPSADARILDLISHEVVLIDAYNPDAEYQKVKLTDGTNGYMHRDFLWSMVGYRAALAKSPDGKWQLCTFVTGD
ncbi:SH3 domain-containing protein [Ruegeria sp. HKCCD8929]|uniref:SH3 domain-containing protein n=1 Tax=Ruegeria sp. HKCCD8929 TaxID=2683006 RepID=UPI0014881952|nr:SH3 domain-containing protein [Ruegeria sp. HKCCD8929]